MQERPSYEDIQAIFLNHRIPASAAEAHGVLAGLLCVDGRLDCQQWLSTVFGDDKAVLNSDEQAACENLCNRTREQLDAFDFSFELCLPDDDHPMSDRAQALSEWCQGFLYGLGYKLGGSDWPGECTEVLDDILQLSRLDAEHADETDEEAYAELTEFVRAGAQLVRSEFEQNAAPQLH
ncbi:MAG: UPF0149 family protein [Methylococcus sp.]|nr:UPF0149 family protein [Methylococcus sp.]